MQIYQESHKIDMCIQASFISFISLLFILKAGLKQFVENKDQNTVSHRLLIQPGPSLKLLLLLTFLTNSVQNS
jgi:hypothetical protein